MVTIKNLSFAFQKNHLLFDGLNLELETGNTYGLFGLNGAGKTTLLNHISGMLFPAGGECNILGKPARRRHPECLRELFVLPEQFDLPPVTGTTYTNIHSPFYPRFDPGYFDTVLTEMEVDTGKPLTDLSYGQRKKFLIAFALATRARLLLLDEPTNGLDIPSKSQFRKIMAAADLSDRCTVISTHQVRDLETIIDHITVLNNGKIIFNRSLDDISAVLEFITVPEDDNRFVIYAEEIFGGKKAIVPNKSQTAQSRIDPELLFNGIIRKTDLINHQFEGR